MQDYTQVELTIRPYSDYDGDSLKPDAGEPIVITGYWSDLRLNRANIPSEWLVYGIRDEEEQTSIARFILVNHLADVILPADQTEALEELLERDHEAIVTDYWFTDGKSLTLPNSSLSPRYDIASQPD